MKRIKKENTLAYNVAFNMCYNAVFQYKRKMYVYISSTWERNVRGENITIIVVREYGTMKYKAINVNENRDKEIKFINL